MRYLVSCAALCLLAASTVAQATASIVATTDLTSRTGSEIRTVPAGTDVTAGVGLFTSSIGPSCSSSSSLSLSNTTTSGTVTVDLSVDASNGTSFFCGAASTSARGDVRVTFTAPAATPGTLQIDVTGFVFSGFFTTVTASADLDDDGDVEVTRPTGFGFPFPLVNTLRLPVVIDPGGVVVGLSASAASSMGAGSAGVTVTFTPAFGALELAGSACGASLRVLDYDVEAGRRLDFEATTAPGLPIAFFVLGVTPMNVPVPPTNCPLRTDILLAVPTALSPAGEALLSVPIQSGLAGTVQVQFLSASVSGATTLWNTSQRAGVTL